MMECQQCPLDGQCTTSLAPSLVFSKGLILCPTPSRKPGLKFNAGTGLPSATNSSMQDLGSDDDTCANNMVATESNIDDK